MVPAGYMRGIFLVVFRVGLVLDFFGWVYGVLAWNIGMGDGY
jgi:hypothetical protein